MAVARPRRSRSPITATRNLLRALSPFGLEQYPNNPAPAHIVNGFVAAGFGVASRAGAVRKFLVETEPLPDGFAFMDDYDDPTRATNLRRDLRTAFNPDRRMWSDLGSPVPVDARLVGNDPTDAGYGPLLWILVENYTTLGPEFRNRVSKLVMPGVPRDGVTAAAQLLGRQSEFGEPRAAVVSAGAWFGESGTAGGQMLASSLAKFVEALIVETEDARRLDSIQHLARGLHLCTALGLLLGPIACQSETAATAYDLSGLVVWADTPPGPNAHPMAAAAAASYRRAIERVRTSLSDSLKVALDAQSVPSSLPAGQVLRQKVRGVLLDGGASADEAERSSEILFQTVGSTAVDRWVDELFDITYTFSFLSRGIRSFGRKVGLIGPDRGAGAPRFVAETPLLATVVHAICPAGGMPLDEFVDAVRERLGLVFGPGTRINLATELGLWEGPAVGERLLLDNQDALQRRLVRAGLAREYSDGHTEVFTNA